MVDRGKYKKKAHVEWATHKAIRSQLRFFREFAGFRIKTNEVDFNILCDTHLNLTGWQSNKLTL